QGGALRPSTSRLILARWVGARARPGVSTPLGESWEQARRPAAHSTPESSTAAGDVRAVLWTRGGIRNLGTPGGSRSQATDINSAGQIVSISETADGETHGFL